MLVICKISQVFQNFDGFVDLIYRGENLIFMEPLELK